LEDAVLPCTALVPLVQFVSSTDIMAPAPERVSEPSYLTHGALAPLVKTFPCHRIQESSSILTGELLSNHMDAAPADDVWKLLDNRRKLDCR
jgi:hypothetical protein